MRRNSLSRRASEEKEDPRFVVLNALWEQHPRNYREIRDYLAPILTKAILEGDDMTAVTYMDKYMRDGNVYLNGQVNGRTLLEHLLAGEKPGHVVIFEKAQAIRGILKPVAIFGTTTEDSDKLIIQNKNYSVKHLQEFLKQLSHLETETGVQERVLKLLSAAKHCNNVAKHQACMKFLFPSASDDEEFQQLYMQRKSFAILMKVLIRYSYTPLRAENFQEVINLFCELQQAFTAEQEPLDFSSIETILEQLGFNEDPAKAGQKELLAYYWKELCKLFFPEPKPNDEEKAQDPARLTQLDYHVLDFETALENFREINRHKIRLDIFNAVFRAKVMLGDFAWTNKFRVKAWESFKNRMPKNPDKSVDDAAFQIRWLKQTISRLDDAMNQDVFALHRKQSVNQRGAYKLGAMIYQRVKSTNTVAEMLKLKEIHEAHLKVLEKPAAAAPR